MALREILASFSIDVDEKSIKKADSMIGALSSKFAAFAVAVGVVGKAGGVLTEFFGNIIHASDATGDWAARLSISAEEMQQFSYMADQVGAKASEITMAFKFMENSVGKAMHGQKGMIKEFERLGISVDDLKNKSPMEMFELFAEKISHVENAAELTATAMKVFGKGGVAVIPLLKMGAAGVHKYNEELNRMGGPVSNDVMNGLSNTQHAFQKVQLAIQMAGAEALTPLLDKFEKFGDMIMDVTGDIRTIVRETTVLRSVFVALAAIMAINLVTGFWPIILAGGVLAAVVVTLIAAFDEVYGTLVGVDSITRRVIDGMFGLGATAAFITNLKKLWGDFFNSIVAMFPGLGKLRELLDLSTFISVLVAFWRVLIFIGQAATVVAQIFAMIAQRIAAVLGLLIQVKDVLMFRGVQENTFTKMFKDIQKFSNAAGDLRDGLGEVDDALGKIDSKSAALKLKYGIAKEKATATQSALTPEELSSVFGSGGLSNTGPLKPEIRAAIEAQKNADVAYSNLNNNVVINQTNNITGSDVSEIADKVPTGFNLQINGAAATLGPVK